MPTRHHLDATLRAAAKAHREAHQDALREAAIAAAERDAQLPAPGSLGLSAGNGATDG